MRCLFGPFFSRLSFPFPPTFFLRECLFPRCWARYPALIHQTSDRPQVSANISRNYNANRFFSRSFLQRDLSQLFAYFSTRTPPQGVRHDTQRQGQRGGGGGLPPQGDAHATGGGGRRGRGWGDGGCPGDRYSGPTRSVRPAPCRMLWPQYNGTLVCYGGFFCCVLVSGKLAFHLLHVDKFRLFGLLCLSLRPHTLGYFTSLQDEESTRALRVC